MKRRLDSSNWRGDYGTITEPVRVGGNMEMLLQRNEESSWGVFASAHDNHPLIFSFFLSHTSTLYPTVCD